MAWARGSVGNFEAHPEMEAERGKLVLILNFSRPQQNLDVTSVFMQKQDGFSLGFLF